MALTFKQYLSEGMKKGRVCRNCGTTVVNPRRRKCTNRKCRSTYFDPETDDQFKKRQAEHKRVGETLKKLMGEETLYHVTHTKHVDNIKKNGLRPMGAASNWIQAGSGKRYGQGEVHVFTHHGDAHRWAAHMDWEHHKGIGTGKISVVHVKKPKDHKFENDTNDPMSLAGRKGKTLKSRAAIGAEHIHKVEPVDIKAAKS